MLPWTAAAMAAASAVLFLWDVRQKRQISSGGGSHRKNIFGGAKSTTDQPIFRAPPASQSGRPKTPFERLGQAKIDTIANTFYDLIESEPKARHIRSMFHDDPAERKEKLRMYLTGWLGGPPLYARKYKTICLTKPHKGLSISDADKEAWLYCMVLALQSAGCDVETQNMLREPFHGLATQVQKSVCEDGRSSDEEERGE